MIHEFLIMIKKKIKLNCTLELTVLSGQPPTTLIKLQSFKQAF